MAGTERQLWKWLSGGLLPEGHYSRIESGLTSPGFPDVYYRLRTNSGTLELKVDRKPRAKVPFKKGGLRPDQLKWIKAEIKMGGLVWIVIRLEKPFKCVIFIPGTRAHRINRSTREQLLELSRLTLPLPIIKKNLYPTRLFIQARLEGYEYEFCE